MKQGSLTAIVKSSGSGKSTLMKLCARFYDPDKGVILLGNKNIREIDPGETYATHFNGISGRIFISGYHKE